MEGLTFIRSKLDGLRIKYSCSGTKTCIARMHTIDTLSSPEYSKAVPNHTLVRMHELPLGTHRTYLQETLVESSERTPPFSSTFFTDKTYTAPARSSATAA